MASTGGPGDAGDRPMFSRDEVLGGLPARRASGVLFAIEAHTARLMASTRVSRATYQSRRSSADREQAFLEAMAAGRDLPLTPTIQDLERHAPSWAHLVPDGADARAALAVLLGGKYRFTADHVPQIVAALHLDDPRVADAVARQTAGRGVFAPSLTTRERIAWWRARLAARVERMPPFWVAYSLALTETITEGILVLPIAVAGIGPLAGVVVLIGLGLVNLVTLGALAEAITRNGNMRFGAAYLGRLVQELIGRPGAVTLSVTLAIFNAVVLLVYFLGFASVLRGATGIPEEAWVLLLFGINVWILRKEALDETVATAVAIGTANVVLILVITLIAFAHVDPANLGYVHLPLLDGAGIDPVLLQLVFGVIIVSYFGHTSAANASKLILGRDPTGRALLWGNLAALATAIVLYCLIVIAFNGALGHEPLVGTRGTAITPLAEVAGPIVDILGSVYVVLAVGLGSLYCSLGLYNQVIEYLPHRSRAPLHGWRGWLSGRWGRYLAGIGPTVVTFLLLEALLLTDQDWFAGPIALVGVLTVPLIGGLFPMLLVMAARRRGEYVPGSVIRVVGHPVTAAVVGGLFWIGVLLHGLVIWESPVERGLALGIAGVMVLLVVVTLRGKALRRTAAIEIRDAQRGASLDPGFAVTVAGRPALATVELEHRDGRTDLHAAAGPLVLDGLRRASFTLDRHDARSLTVWIHRVTLDGESIAIPADIRLHDGDGRAREAVRADGMVGMELGDGPARVDITFGGATGIAGSPA